MKESAIDIGSRLELFVDDYLIDRLAGATLNIHSPSPQNVVLRFDRPWEGNSCNFVSVFKDADKYRMYYRSGHPRMRQEYLTRLLAWMDRYVGARRSDAPTANPVPADG